MSTFTSQHSRFEKLMRHRLLEILVVSSPYDHFTLEEDGRLDEALLVEYRQLHLTHTPRLTHVTTAAEALQTLQDRPFDLVITMTRVGEMEVHEFGREVKRLCPELPVVLLTYDTRELAVFKEGDGIDRVFVWSGDARILLAIFKLFEDLLNVAEDTREGDLQVLILVEDSVRFYSIYLPLLFHEVMKQTRTLMAEGINLHHKLLRMRARAKVLLATSMEEAEQYFELYGDHVLGLITDAGFPNQGVHDMEAGPKLITKMREQYPHLPVMIQSSRTEFAQRAEKLHATYLDKNSPHLLRSLREFMQVNLGFGDFIFTRPDGTPVGRATDMQSMLELLPHLPLDTVLYHAQRNHYSNWFRARTEFDLAKTLLPRRISEFQDLEQVRDYLIRILTTFQQESHRGGVTDFTALDFDATSSFVRVGGGSLGGKGRGLAFVNSLLPTLDLASRFPDLEVVIPKSAVLGTSVFDQFMEANRLEQLAYSESSDEELARGFLAGRLPGSIFRDLKAIVEQWCCPLAVRSSSLLEDSQHQPFAGVYHTYLLPNDHQDPKVRLRQLTDAIKLVMASTFYRASKDYIAATPNKLEEEKMAVVIQQMAGQRHGEVFYPTFAGVARSYNFYPVGDIQPEEGLVAVALGLGKTVVDGGKCLRFSPAHPRQLFQFANVEETLNTSQRSFWALDLTRKKGPLEPDPNANLVLLDLARAEADGQLYTLGSVYSPDNDAIYDGISRPGIRLVSFAGILKHEALPLVDVLQELLSMGEQGFSGSVELEFAVDHDPLQKLHRLSFLQIRPLVAEAVEVEVDLEAHHEATVLCSSAMALGNGLVEGIEDVLYVHPDRLERAHTQEAASIIETFNRRLLASRRPYLLMGPGRWGSGDPWLGIPVTWGQISGARVIVETDLADYVVTPSQGTHFFQNILSFGVGYLTVNQGQGTLDWDQLEALTPVKEEGPVRHVRLDRPVKVLLDGRTSRGLILLDET